MNWRVRALKAISRTDARGRKPASWLGSLFAGRSADGSRSGAASAAASGSGFLGRARLVVGCTRLIGDQSSSRKPEAIALSSAPALSCSVRWGSANRPPSARFAVSWRSIAMCPILTLPHQPKRPPRSALTTASFTLAEGQELHIYGSPGQERFAFMREWLMSLAVGAVILVDLADHGALDSALTLIREAEASATSPVVAVVIARPASESRFRRSRRRCRPTLMHQCRCSAPMFATASRCSMCSRCCSR